MLKVWVCGSERLVGGSHNSVINWGKQEVAGQTLAKIDASTLLQRYL